MWSKHWQTCRLLLLAEHPLPSMIETFRSWRGMQVSYCWPLASSKQKEGSLISRHKILLKLSYICGIQHFFQNLCWRASALRYCQKIIEATERIDDGDEDTFYSETWEFRSGATVKVVLKKNEWIATRDLLEAFQELTPEKARQIRTATRLAPVQGRDTVHAGG